MGVSKAKLYQSQLEETLWAALSELTFILCLHRFLKKSASRKQNKTKQKANQHVNNSVLNFTSQVIILLDLNYAHLLLWFSSTADSQWHAYQTKSWKYMRIQGQAILKWRGAQFRHASRFGKWEKLFFWQSCGVTYCASSCLNEIEYPLHTAKHNLKS